MNKFVAPLVLGTALLGASPSFAQSAGSSAITQMQSDAQTVSTVANGIIPIAVGSIIFGAGALLFKKFVYA